MSALTLSDAKVHLNITVPTFDTELQAVIDSAEAIVAGRVGPLASTATTAPHVVPTWPACSSLVLPVTPALSLTSVTSNLGAVLTVGDLTVTPWGVVEYTTASSLGVFPSSWYTVVYLAGRSTVPAGLLFAVKEMVRHLWTSQQGAGRPGNQQAQSPGFLIPNMVREAMEPYAQPGFA